jgi:hypothetical protein
LSAAYGRADQENGDLPAFEDLEFGAMSDELLARGKRLLAILELCNFQWTLEEILEQPEAETNAVFYMKNIGEKMRIQNRNNGINSADHKPRQAEQ